MCQNIAIYPYLTSTAIILASIQGICVTAGYRVMFEGLEREPVVRGWIASAFSVSALFSGVFMLKQLTYISQAHITVQRHNITKVIKAPSF